MVALYQLIFFLMALLNGQVVYHEVDGTIDGVDIYGRERQAPAAMDCFEGVPHVWLGDGVTFEIFAHELVHAYDCVDDGEMNGSPWPDRPPPWPVGERIVTLDCWLSDVEWAACESVHDPAGALKRWRARD